jgi:hypothetical protein
MRYERLMAKLLRELLATAAAGYRTPFDVLLALQARCRQLRIDVTRRDLDEVITRVGSNHPTLVALTMTSSERAQAQQMRRAWGGCWHRPRCDRYEQCLIRIVIRTRASAKQRQRQMGGDA